MLVRNSHPLYQTPIDPADWELFSRETIQLVERCLFHWAANAPTPLLNLRGLAKDKRVASIHIKDESSRLGLGGLEALGAASIVTRLVLEEASRQLGRDIEADEIPSPAVRSLVANMTIASIASSSFGVSAAAAAQMIGVRTSMFVSSEASDDAASARVPKLGARIIRVDGTDDEILQQAETVCRQEGLLFVSPPSRRHSDRNSRLVMQSYWAIIKEALDKLSQIPTHVFVQGGSVELATAVGSYLLQAFVSSRPLLIVVEPEDLDCGLAQLPAGNPIDFAGEDQQAVAMREIHDPSTLASRVLARSADAYLTITNRSVAEAMRRLARPHDGDQVVVAGEWGAVGLAGFLSSVRDPKICQDLQLNSESRVLVINAEGGSDRIRYAAIVGSSPEAILETFI